MRSRWLLVLVFVFAGVHLTRQVFADEDDEPAMPRSARAAGFYRGSEHPQLKQSGWQAGRTARPKRVSRGHAHGPPTHGSSEKEKPAAHQPGHLTAQPPPAVDPADDAQPQLQAQNVTARPQGQNATGDAASLPGSTAAATEVVLPEEHYKPLPVGPGAKYCHTRPPARLVVGEPCAACVECFS